MKKTTALFVIISTVLTISACQTTPQQFNGQSGYQVIEKNEDTATINYVLPTRVDKHPAKLQAACQKVLGSNKQYKIQILSQIEIPNQPVQTTEFGKQLGQSRTNIALSDTLGLYSDNNTATTNQALAVKPNALLSIRYTCS